MSAQPAPENPPPPPTPAKPTKSGGVNRFFWQGKIPEAFWKGATLFSFVVNFILVLVLLFALLLIFDIKRGIAHPLLGGLYESFVDMDEASIKTTIQVNDTIMVTDIITVDDHLPVVFNLPLSTNTTVTLTEPIPLPNTLVYLNGAPVPADIVLAAGTPLKIKLDLTVPVSQSVPVLLRVPVNLKVPVSLNVPVDIALDQTELHRPFVNLAKIVGPYNHLLNQAPDSWGGLLSGQPGEPYKLPDDPATPQP
jgi:hypothetical protein